MNNEIFLLLFFSSTYTLVHACMHICVLFLNMHIINYTYTCAFYIPNVSLMLYCTILKFGINFHRSKLNLNIMKDIFSSFIF